MGHKMPKHMIEAIKKVSELSNEDLFEVVVSDHPSDEMDAYGHDSAFHSAHCQELEKRLIENGFLDKNKMEKK